MEENKNRKIGLIIGFIVIMLFIGLLLIINNKHTLKDNYNTISSDGNISSYKIDLALNANNTINVNESIEVTFDNSSYNGIDRVLPKWHKYSNLNNEESLRRLDYNNLKKKYIVSEYEDDIKLKIGSGMDYVSNETKVYDLNYIVNVGEDNNIFNDEFIYELVNTNNNIKDIIIDIELPVNIDKSNLAFYYNNEDITNKLGIEVKDNILHTSLNDCNIKGSLYVKYKLPNNYFVKTKSTYGLVSFMLSLTIIIMSSFGFILIFKYNRDIVHSITRKQYEIPDNLDPASVAYIIGNKNYNDILIALLLSLVSKKMIKIEKTKDNKYNAINIGMRKSKKDLTVNEKILYQEIFKDSNEFKLTEKNVNVLIKNKLELNLVELSDDERIVIYKRIAIVLGISLFLFIISYYFFYDMNPNYNILYLISYVSIMILGIYIIISEHKVRYKYVIKDMIEEYRLSLFKLSKEEFIEIDKEDKNFYNRTIPYLIIFGDIDDWNKKLGKKEIEINDNKINIKKIKLI